MRIAVNALGFRPRLGEAEDAFLRNALALLPDTDPQLDVVFLVSEPARKAFGKRACVCSPAPLGVAESAKAAMAKCAALKTDLLVTPLDAFPPACPVPVAAYALDPPANEESAPRLWPFGKRRASGVARACEEAEALLASSDFVREELLERGAPEDKVFTTPFGASPVYGEAGEGLVEEPYLLALSSTAPRHGVDCLVRVFARLPQHAELSLVLAGGAQKDEPGDWGPGVMRIDQLPESRLAALYQHAALFVCPHVSDGNGYGVLQAMRAGARVVAARSGALPEIAGRIAVFFEPGDEQEMGRAIMRGLYEPPSQRNPRTHVGKNVAAAHTWEACRQRIATALRSRRAEWKGIGRL